MRIKEASYQAHDGFIYVIRDRRKRPNLIRYSPKRLAKLMFLCKDVRFDTVPEWPNSEYPRITLYF